MRREGTGIGSIKVNKIDLIRILEKNRDAHHANFEKACEGYKKKAEEALRGLMKAVKSGKLVGIYVHNVPVPEDHTDDYTRVIEMLMMHDDERIEISEQAFMQYVQDRWEWTHSWELSTLAYNSPSGD